MGFICVYARILKLTVIPSRAFCAGDLLLLNLPARPSNSRSPAPLSYSSLGWVHRGGARDDSRLGVWLESAFSAMHGYDAIHAHSMRRPLDHSFTASSKRNIRRKHAGKGRKFRD